jgi:phosphate transport system protein
MDLGLGKLNVMLLEMANISENAVTLAIGAYQKGEKDSQVKQLSFQLRSLHHQVSELAMEIMARYQPVASDLRFLKACFEISYGFFRYGRYARDIVEVLELFGDISACNHQAVIETAKMTQEMMRLSIDAFARRDVELARKIPDMDDSIDERYRANLKNLLNQSRNVKCALSEVLILRYLERIADHASYISGSVVYIVSGEEPPV